MEGAKCEMQFPLILPYLLWKTLIPGDSQELGKLENEYGCSIIAKGWSEVPRTWSTGEHM